MKIVADFHVHSKYSRATSPEMNIENMAKWAKLKGINLVGTGDFTHPLWFAELKEKLVPLGNGLFEHQGVNFILTAEISCIYKQGGKVRKIHHVIMAPSFEVVEKINQALGSRGNIVSDGRPILGLTSIELADIILNASPDCFIIPAHAWTPWFSIFGSKSGFDTIEECYGKFAKHIKAIETGLSSDPSMNWRLSQLDDIALISCSDAHSPSKLGREACVFETNMDYRSIIDAIISKDPGKFIYTIEFFPEEGKYHYDGHSNCNIRWSPLDTKVHKGICPICNKLVTVGVMNRVDALADREIGIEPKGAIPFRRLVPLQEIIAEGLDKGVGTKSVQEEYQKMVNELGTEFHILLDLDEKELRIKAKDKIAEGIIRVRKGKLNIKPGYDGLFGEVKIFSSEQNTDLNQIDLF